MTIRISKVAALRKKKPLISAKIQFLTNLPSLQKIKFRD